MTDPVIEGYASMLDELRPKIDPMTRRTLQEKEQGIQSESEELDKKAEAEASPPVSVEAILELCEAEFRHISQN